MSLGLDEIFSSRGRVRVLLALFRLGEANITRIVRETGMHHRIVATHLEKLVEAGLAVEKRYGRLRIFRINYSNPKTIIVRDLLEVLSGEQP